MKTNVKKSYALKTHEGGMAFPHNTAYQELRRSVLSCLLWEDSFYESGVSVTDRIRELAGKVTQQQLSDLAIEARSIHNLRHVPLLLTVELAKNDKEFLTSKTLFEVIQRPDEITEFLSLYWQEGKCPISAQVKKGLAKAFTKFDAYQLAKYNRNEAIKLRDVLFLVHAKPKKVEGEVISIEKAIKKGRYERGEVLRHENCVLGKLAEGILAPPDTWEVALSSGGDKKTEFERLLKEGNLGYMALLRNLRNMVDSGVDMGLIRNAIRARKGARRVLPFRYVAAARYAPSLEPVIDEALLKAIDELPELPGKTVVVVDVSGSMEDRLSGKSDMTRMDAACALASLLKGDIRTFSFSNAAVEVPTRKGMAGIDAIKTSQSHGGTNLTRAVAEINSKVDYDRIIVITDEQSADRSAPVPKTNKAYLINVAAYKNGIGYGKWKHLDGFSENVIKWIYEYENQNEIEALL